MEKDQSSNRIIYWGLVYFFFTFLVLFRRAEIFGLSPSFGDILISLVWILLVLSPLFSEIDIFGIKVKREIEKLREDINLQFSTIRADVRNSVTNNNEVSPQVIVYPPESALPQIKEAARQATSEVLKDKTVEPISSLVSDTPDEVKFAGIVRYNLEKQVNRLYYENGLGDPETRRVSLRRKIDALIGHEIIKYNLGMVISDIYAVASAILHAEKLSPAQSGFLEGVSDDVIGALKATNASRKL